MNIEELSNFIEWEGGLYEAVAGYGLTSENMGEDVDPEFITLFEEYVEKANALRRLENSLEEWLDSE